MKLVVFTTSQPFVRFLKANLDAGFVIHPRLQSPVDDADQLYLLHLSSMKAAGLEWMRKHVSGRSLNVAVCSDLPELGEMLESVRLGARAYCNSHMAPQHYRQMLRLLGQGQSWFPPDMVGKAFQLAQQALRPDTSADRLQGLTNREREIALAVGEGLSNRQIADSLSISEATVKTHLTSTFKKLDVGDRVGLVLLLKRG